MVERKYRPWHPVKVHPDDKMPSPSTHLDMRASDCAAIKAVFAGTASPDQQTRSIHVMMNMTGMNDIGWMPEEHGGARDTDFSAGGRHFGFQLRKLLTFNLGQLTGDSNDRSGDSRSNRRAGKPTDGRNADRAKQ